MCITKENGYKRAIKVVVGLGVNPEYAGNIVAGIIDGKIGCLMGVATFESYVTEAFKTREFLSAAGVNDICSNLVISEKTPISFNFIEFLTECKVVGNYSEYLTDMLIRLEYASIRAAREDVEDEVVCGVIVRYVTAIADKYKHSKHKQLRKFTIDSIINLCRTTGIKSEAILLASNLGQCDLEEYKDILTTKYVNRLESFLFANKVEDSYYSGKLSYLGLSNFLHSSKIILDLEDDEITLMFYQLLSNYAGKKEFNGFVDCTSFFTEESVRLKNVERFISQAISSSRGCTVEETEDRFNTILKPFGLKVDGLSRKLEELKMKEHKTIGSVNYKAAEAELARSISETEEEYQQYVSLLDTIGSQFKHVTTSPVERYRYLLAEYLDVIIRWSACGIDFTLHGRPYKPEDDCCGSQVELLDDVLLLTKLFQNGGIVEYSKYTVEMSVGLMRRGFSASEAFTMTVCSRENVDYVKFLILQKEFEANLNMAKAISVYKSLSIENEEEFPVILFIRLLARIESEAEVKQLYSLIREMVDICVEEKKFMSFYDLLWSKKELISIAVKSDSILERKLWNDFLTKPPIIDFED